MIHPEGDYPERICNVLIPYKVKRKGQVGIRDHRELRDRNLQQREPPTFESRN